MKKMLFLCFLVWMISFSLLSHAEDETTSTVNQTIVDEPTSTGGVVAQKGTSRASIGFSSKSVKEEGSKKPLIGQLPSTGEAVGIGLSLFGLMLIIILFRNTLKKNDYK